MAELHQSEPLAGRGLHKCTLHPRAYLLWWVQAAIVALNLVGRPLTARNGMLGSNLTPPAKSPSTAGPQILGPVLLPAVQDTSDLDGKTAAEVLDLEAKKRHAVVREDYDEAKQLKTVVERLRSFGRRIAELETKCVPVVHCTVFYGLGATCKDCTQPAALQQEVGCMVSASAALLMAVICQAAYLSAVSESNSGRVALIEAFWRV